VKPCAADYLTGFLVDNILFYIGENNIRSQKAVEKIGSERIFVIEGVPLETRPNASVIYNITKKKWTEFVSGS